MEALIQKSSKPELLRIAEAARRLCVEPVTLRAWARQRKISVHRFGRAVRISAGEIDRLIRESFVAASDSADMTDR